MCLVNSIIIYLGIMLVIYLTKPDFLYNKKNNKFKSFDETVFSIELIGLVLPIIIYYTLYNMSMNHNKHLYLLNKYKNNFN